MAEGNEVSRSYGGPPDGSPLLPPWEAMPPAGEVTADRRCEVDPKLLDELADLAEWWRQEAEELGHGCDNPEGDPAACLKCAALFTAEKLERLAANVRPAEAAWDAAKPIPLTEEQIARMKDRVLSNVCPRCEGSGRYSRLGEPEKPCAVCGGDGKMPDVGQILDERP